MEELLQNTQESLESAEDDLLKKRFNSAVASFFRAITNYCDYIIYKDIRILPKNHNERFNLLEKYFKEIHEKVLELFKKYRETYNLRMTEKDAQEIKKYSYEIKNIATNKK